MLFGLFYPTMTAFTDQYSLPNIFFLYWSVINRTYKCKTGYIGGYCFQIHTQNYFKYIYHRPVSFIYDLRLQDKYNTCALSKHIAKYVYSARNAGKDSGKTRLFPRRRLASSLVSKPHTHITYMLRPCTSIVYLFPTCWIINKNTQYEWSNLTNNVIIVTDIIITWQNQSITGLLSGQYF